MLSRTRLRNTSVLVGCLLVVGACNLGGDDLDGEDANDQAVQDAGPSENNQDEDAGDDEQNDADETNGDEGFACDPDEIDELQFVVGHHEDEWLEYSLHVDSEPQPLDDEIEERFSAGNYDITTLDDGTYLIEGQTGTAEPEDDPMHGDSYEWLPDEECILGWEADKPHDEYVVRINDEEIDPSTLPELELDEDPDSNDSDPNGSTVDYGIRHSLYDGPVGGGSGMPDDQVHSESDADSVVANGSELEDAVANASPGEVIYVQGSISGDININQEGVVIAGNRGIGSDGEIQGSVTINADDVELHGLTLDGQGASQRIVTINARDTYFFNCEVKNSGSAPAIDYAEPQPGTHWRQSQFRNFGHYGHFKSYDEYTDESHKVIIEYSDFADLGQHMISGAILWWHLRDNHFHGTLNGDPDHVLEVRAPNSYRVNGGPNECGAPAGNAIVEHNLHETASQGNKSRLVVIRGEPTEEVVVRNNHAPDNAAPTGGCWQNDTHGGWGSQLVLQNAAEGDDFSDNVEISGNVLD